MEPSASPPGDQLVHGEAGVSSSYRCAEAAPSNQNGPICIPNLHETDLTVSCKLGNVGGYFPIKSGFPLS